MLVEVQQQDRRAAIGMHLLSWRGLSRPRPCCRRRRASRRATPSISTPNTHMAMPMINTICDAQQPNLTGSLLHNSLVDVR
jgi:hypothetical protein